MNNFKQIFLSLTVCISLHTIGAERPLQPPKLPTFGQMVEQKPEWQAYKKQAKYAQEILGMQKKLQQLPPELRKMTFRYLMDGMYPNLNKITSIIIALADTIDASMLLDYLKSLLHTANAVDITERLQEAGVSLVNNPEICKWFTAAKGRLVFGEELHTAVCRDNLKRIQELLENKNIDLNYRYHSTHLDTAPMATPLILVAQAMSQRNALQIANLLINVGVTIDAQDFYGDTALMKAAHYGNVEIVRSLLNAGADPNIQGQYGGLISSTLMRAGIHHEYMRGKREFTKNWTALMRAAYIGNIEIVKLLLDAGANPTVIDKENKSARDYALAPYPGKNSEMLVKVLEEATKKWEATHE